jgi:hypothetical protein
MYVHGVISIIQEGQKQFLSLNSLPILVLSCPAILLDHIQTVYNSPLFVTAFQHVLLNGVVEVASPGGSGRRSHRTRVDAEFAEALDRLFRDNLLMRRVVDFATFSTDDVFAVERRASNLALSRKRGGAAPADTPFVPEKVTVPIADAPTLTVNWNGVATFLRGRFVVQSTQSFLGPSFVPLVQAILSITDGCDYSPHRRLGQEPDDRLRGRTLLLPRLEFLKLMDAYKSEREDVFTRLDGVCGSQLSLLRSGDGSYWFVTVPHAIRALQMQYMEMYAEQSLSPYHRRCFNHVRDLTVADTHQIESGALLSEKDARSSMYGLCRLGLVQMQSIPRNAADRMIGPKTIFAWRYDESAAIEAYRTIIGEHARRILARVAAFNDAFEKSEGAETASKTAAQLREKKEKQLVALNACYADALRVFILFAEM